MTSVSETTRTLRYELRSREIYIEEPITSPELLSEHPQTQEESIRSIQETPNSQFRLVLSVTPCVPRISSLESVNDNTSPLLFSSTSSLTFVPTPDSPKDQPPPSPTSSTSSLTSFHSCNTSSQHNTLSPELFSPTPTSQNKWPSPPPLPQRSPRIRRRHNLHNYASLASTNRSQEKRNSVGAPPLDYLTPATSHITIPHHGTPIASTSPVMETHFITTPNAISPHFLEEPSLEPASTTPVLQLQD